MPEQKGSFLPGLRTSQRGHAHTGGHTQGQPFGKSQFRECRYKPHRHAGHSLVTRGDAAERKAAPARGLGARRHSELPAQPEGERDRRSGTCWKCWLTSRDRELRELQRESYKTENTRSRGLRREGPVSLAAVNAQVWLRSVSGSVRASARALTAGPEDAGSACQAAGRAGGVTSAPQGLCSQQ